MCLALADGGIRCDGTPKNVINARRRLSRTRQLLEAAQVEEDKQRVEELTARLKQHATEATEAEFSHEKSFLNPYRDFTAEEVQEIMDERIAAQEFKELLQGRDEARSAHLESEEATKKLKEEYDELKKQYNKELWRSTYENARGAPLDASEIQEIKDEMDQKFHEFRTARFETYEKYAEFLEARDQLDAYKNQTALAAARLAEVTSFEVEYEGDTLGNAVKTVTFESGTREWLENRQGGIGGSDVGPMLKMHPEHGVENYAEVFASKVDEYTDEEIEAQLKDHTSFASATGRGNAWEPVIAQRFAEEHPEFTLIHSKSSWVGTDPNKPWQYVNMDGILSDREDGEPNGILEIKTSSNEADWDNGIPVDYRAQVLHYLDATGFEYAYVAALIDDHDFRVYRIDHDDPIDPTGTHPKLRDASYTEATEELSSVWNKVEQERTYRAKISSGEIEPRQIGKSSWSYNSSNFSTVAQDIAAYTERPYHQVRRELGFQASPEDRDAYMTNLLTSHDYTTNQKDIVSIDLETSGMSPYTGEIIEIGITRRRQDGTVVDTYQELFSPDERVLKVNGTGAEDVHNISPAQVEGKRNFRNPEIQQRVKEIMGIGEDNTVMLAHNAAFEKTWLNQYLDGFYDNTPPVIDTMRLSRYMVHDTENNKLATFAPRFGVPYVNAHRALIDAEMTVDAFLNFREEVKETGNRVGSGE